MGIRMQIASDLVNLFLAGCAIGYSFMPPERVRNYNRRLSLVMRAAGGILLAITGASIFLKLLGGC